MEIKFKQLVLKNFKSHRDLTVDFGEHTAITADNAKGKSTIAQSITWLLYGTDPLGSKLDPTPITYEADETMVSLLLEVDSKDLLLGRGLKKGKTQYYINEVPSKAGEFNELLEKLFDKELFMSLFNPNYFPSLHWEKQRAMLLQYVTAPLKKDVLKHMQEVQAVELEKLLKKHSLDDLEKVHKANKTKLDKQYIAAQSRTKTLREQLETFTPSAPYESLLSELNTLKKQREEIEKITDEAGTINSRINTLQNQINALLIEREHLKENFTQLKNEKIEDHCRVCKQPLQGEAITAAKQEKQERMNRVKNQFDEVVIKRKELEAELKSLEYVDISEQLAKARDIQEKINQIEIEIANYKQLEGLKKQIEQAEKDEKEVLESLNESIFIIDSIKAYRAKEAELQGEKVQALFETLSIKLFQLQKNGEYKPTFEIEMDGKPYSKLSLSEGIKAGLELREVLAKQSNLIVPVFIDNAESITSFKQPTGQLITSKVVAGQELKIDSVTNDSDEITVDIEVIA